MVAAESSKLPENHDIIRGLTDTIHKLESRVTETETKRDKKMNKMIQENKDLSETIHQLQVNAAITEARREEEVERLQESYNKITDFITRLAEGLAQIEVKTADIELQTEEFAKFKDQKGKLLFTVCNVYQRVDFSQGSGVTFNFSMFLVTKLLS